MLVCLWVRWPYHHNPIAWRGNAGQCVNTLGYNLARSTSDASLVLDACGRGFPLGARSHIAHTYASNRRGYAALSVLLQGTSAFPA
ncbi:hypothetical protein RJT34_19249 [Clitoria ternatea]|uniref:Uncharacterized protein n=1 Tax=Clitoria ternatea TaxID=43366 RepID=A0AAN9IR31_CLITE